MSGLAWTLLRAFVAVAETGSLSGAAVHLGSTQPTLSRHIRELEGALGIALFTLRAGSRPEAALGLVDDARAIAAVGAGAQGTGSVGAAIGTVRVTASVVVANLILPPALVALREAVDVAFARLEGKVELVHAPKLLLWGNRSVHFRDPECTIVSLFTPMAETAQARFGSR